MTIRYAKALTQVRNMLKHKHSGSEQLNELLNITHRKVLFKYLTCGNLDINVYSDISTSAYTSAYTE